MNEQTIKLYKLAHVPHTVIDPSNNMPYETTIFSAEKFAELIIKECIIMADQFEIDVNRAGLVDRIKEHFGVE